jgi:hypothetical protein
MKGTDNDMKPRTITDFRIVSAKARVANTILLAACLAFGFVPPSNAQGQKDGSQSPALLKNMGGAGQALSHWLPGSPVPYPELISIDQLEPKDFGLKNKNCYGPRNNRHCTFGDKSLVPYRQCSARGSSSLAVLLVRSSVDTAICAKPLGRWMYGDWMPPAES